MRIRSDGEMQSSSNIFRIRTTRSTSTARRRSDVFARPRRHPYRRRETRLLSATIFTSLVLALNIPLVTSFSNEDKYGYPSMGATAASKLYSRVKRNEVIVSDQETNETQASQPFLPTHLQNAHRPRLRNDQVRSYQHMVVFAFTATLNNGGQQAISLSEKTHIIALHRGDQLKLSCLARLFGIGDDLDVQWWKDGQIIAASNATIMISNDDDDQLGTYRCIAEVATFSTDLFSAYFFSRMKRAADMPAGWLLSSAIVVRRAVPVVFVSHPQSVMAVSNTTIRLECATNIANQPWQTIRWYRNNAPLNLLQLKNSFKIYTTNNFSVLHIIGTAPNDSGQYHCESGTTRSEVANLTVFSHRTFERPLNVDERFTLVKELSRETFVKVGENVVIECLFVDPAIVVSWTAVNAYGQTIRISDDSSASNTSKTAIKILNASEDVGGSYTCHGALDGDIRKFSTSLTVRVPPLLLMEYLVSRMTKTQGTTTRLHCSATNDPDDTSLDISWYKDGKKITPFGRVKLQPAEGLSSEITEDDVGISSVEFSKDLLISSVQQSNQGLYQCIVSNSVGEQTAVVGLTVEADFDSRITDLVVTTDHANSQFDLEWKLPTSVDYVQAQSSLFLLSYYLSNGGSANNVPLHNVQCTADNRCRAKCCSPNYTFLPRRNYTFQMSTLLTIDKVAKISPLSDQISVVSWDGAAKKALDLFVSASKADVISIRWLHPSEDISNGVVQRYAVDYYKIPSGSNDESSSLRTESVAATRNEFQITGVRPRETYRFRVVPITRHGSPSNMLLKLDTNFTFIAYTVDSPSRGLDGSLGSPILHIKQNNESSLQISWRNDSIGGEFGYGDQIPTVLLKYARSGGSSLKEKAVEAPYDNNQLTLNDRFEAGHAYQFCGRLYVGARHGADFCRIFRMAYKSLTDIFGDIASRTQLPRPVRCENAEGNKSECYCEPSREFGDAMRVIWKWPADDYSADEFVVHYTLDENDIEEDDRMVITDEFFADLPSLKSSTTYRVMVEARNKAGGVEGFWFNCTTPTLMQIPAPNDVTYAKLNETAVEVKWSPTVANPQWSTPVGYVIQVQTSSTSIPASEIVVDGIKTSRYVLTVQPHVLYTIRVAARSSTGEIGVRSPPYLLTTTSRSNSPKASAKSADEKHKRRTFLSKSYKEAILIAAVVIVGLLTICFAAICAHFRMKRRKLQMGLNGGMHARNDANFAACMRSYEMEGLLPSRGDRNVRDIRTMNRCADIQETELQFDSARSSLAEGRLSLAEPQSLDTKGGERGALPSGRDKYEKLLSDDKFLQRLREAGLRSKLTTPRVSHIKKNSVDTTSSVRMRVDGRLAMFRESSERSFDTKNGRCTPRNHIRVITEPICRRRNGERIGNTNRSSTESGAGDSLAVPNILCRLAALPDIPWPTCTNSVQPYTRAAPLSCMVAPHSSFVRSNSCHFDDMREQRVEHNNVRAMMSSYTAQSPYNTISLQSLAFEEGNSICNDCERSPREIVTLHHTAASSSMPNLTDSGIVYDEHHPIHHLVT
uniref:Uncharacterized protein n=1 Tax=Parascaris univalens TaxID=6257 RepID=A0A915AB59_PARUN